MKALLNYTYIKAALTTIWAILIAGCGVRGPNFYSDTINPPANNPQKEIIFNFGGVSQNIVPIAYFSMHVETLADREAFRAEAQEIGNEVGADECYWVGPIIGAGELVGVLTMDLNRSSAYRTAIHRRQ